MSKRKLEETSEEVNKNQRVDVTDSKIVSVDGEEGEEDIFVLRSIEGATNDDLVRYLAGTRLAFLGPKIKEMGVTGGQLLKMTKEDMEREFKCDDFVSTMMIDLITGHQDMINLADKLADDPFAWESWKSSDLHCIGNMDTEYLSKLTKIRKETIEKIQRVMLITMERRIIRVALNKSIGQP